MAEIRHNEKSVMKKGYPVIKKLGACSPNGEMTPFVWQGRLMRLELSDPTNGLDTSLSQGAIIRDVESKKIISNFALGSYYHAAYVEDGKIYVTGVKLSDTSTILVYESTDLINWEERILLTNPGWRYFNTSITKGPQGYVILMEASEPEEYMGEEPFTFFFATSPDLKKWTFMDYDLCFSKDRYNGGPFMKYSEGWYYVFSVTKLPCYRFTNYVFRTKDFKDWYVGDYNPVLMPSNEDRLISPRAADLSDEFIKEIKESIYLSNNSDIDMCDYNGKTYINYSVGNQLGSGYMAEAEYDGTVAEFLKHLFDE